ncbi:MAG: hypothetical protein JRH01_14160 [Deltaproteobacteria bacterium]|nr:hypothetical protein [Deltaproteobacteria bacterium]MBW2394337.1 hypothetical protein [Deltaproteobacteria bacterium]
MPTLRRLVPEDAEKLVSCFERCYGPSYVDGDFYDAKKIRSRLADGRLRSIVAVSESGEIVGHMGLTARSSEAVTADAGNTVVDPSSRNQKLAGRLGLRLMDLCREVGLIGFHHYPTTAHPVMQRLAVQAGGVETGIMLDYIPAETDYRELSAGQVAQRLAVVVVYQALAPAPARDVFLPERHRHLLARLYAACDLERTFRDSSPEPVRSACDLEVVEFARRGLLRIEVRRTGADLVERMAAALRGADAELFQLDLPLSDAGVSQAVDAAEASGFFYSALLPEYLEGDVLRLQKPSALLGPATRELLASEGARSMFDYIEADTC